MKILFKQWNAIIFLAMFFGCTTEKKEKDVEIGEYVYLDRYNCIHVRQNCVNLFLSGGEDGEEPRYMVQRVEIRSLPSIGMTCSSCVTDEAYKILLKRINKKNPIPGNENKTY